jgi:hypothetical protein
MYRSYRYKQDVYVIHPACLIATVQQYISAIKPYNNTNTASQNRSAAIQHSSTAAHPFQTLATYRARHLAGLFAQLAYAVSAWQVPTAPAPAQQKQKHCYNIIDVVCII